MLCHKVFPSHMHTNPKHPLILQSTRRFATMLEGLAPPSNAAKAEDQVTCVGVGFTFQFSPSYEDPMLPINLDKIRSISTVETCDCTAEKMMLGGAFLRKRQNWWEIVATLYTLGESNSIYPVFSLGSSPFSGLP